jgi:hypothetical protein
MTKSIMQEDNTSCFLCGRNGSSDPLELHHCFPGNPNRKHSDEDGLVVWLCGNRCHRNGNMSAHKSAVTAELLKAEAQKAYEEKHSRSEFMTRYGKNYL